jgi:hypothetical protein
MKTRLQATRPCLADGDYVGLIERVEILRCYWQPRPDEARTPRERWTATYLIHLHRGLAAKIHDGLAQLARQTEKPVIVPHYCTFWKSRDLILPPAHSSDLYRLLALALSVRRPGASILGTEIDLRQPIGLLAELRLVKTKQDRRGRLRDHDPLRYSVVDRIHSLALNSAVPTAPPRFPDVVDFVPVVAEQADVQQRIQNSEHRTPNIGGIALYKVPVAGMASRNGTDDRTVVAPAGAPVVNATGAPDATRLIDEFVIPPPLSPEERRRRLAERFGHGWQGNVSPAAPCERCGDAQCARDYGQPWCPRCDS